MSQFAAGVGGWGFEVEEIGVDHVVDALAAAEEVGAVLRDALADRVIDEEALLLFALIEGFSFSSALFSAPLRETDVRAVVTATVRRLRDACPPAGEAAEESRSRD